MSDPLKDRPEIPGLLDAAHRASLAYLEALDDSPARLPGAEEAVAKLASPLPEQGDGSAAALEALLDGLGGAIRSSGPRFFHFVQGGTTPAALAADWVASTLDQNPAMWIASPLGARLEVIAISWLKDLFGLPREWGGVLTTGAQMANFTGLAAARRWWGLRHGVDVDAKGLAGLPPVPVFTSGLVHPSVVKTMGMLGIGRDAMVQPTRDDIGTLDLDALELELAALGGAPAILVATAGEPNAGAFDPLDELADLAESHDCWLHVDGAFGLFAALSPSSAHLTAGVERAHSVISDGHKWLNVPYDCGFAFVRDPELMSGAFAIGAAYLSPTDDSERPNAGYLSPESSRRARSLAVWATLRAYGRAGHRAMVERHLDLARHLARRVDEAGDLERLAEVPLNIVCFRYAPRGVAEGELDELNSALGNALIEDGRVYVGTTLYGTRRALRPAIVNWRTTEADIDLLVDVVREVGAQVADQKATR